MAEIPDGIVLERHRDLEGRMWHIWVRRTLLLGVAAILVLALFNVFGQRASTSRGSTSQADVEIYGPRSVRGGLLFEARITIDAKQELKQATVVLSPGWLEGMTINTIEPSPLGEASRNGSLSLDLGHIRQGSHYTLYLQFQVNPTNIGSRSQTVDLLDGTTPILSLHRSIRIWP